MNKKTVEDYKKELKESVKDMVRFTAILDQIKFKDKFLSVSDISELMNYITRLDKERA